MARPSTLVALIALAAFATPLPLQAHDPPPSAQRDLLRENLELKAQVERLKAEIRTLQAKIRAQNDLQWVPYHLIPAQPATPGPVPSGDGMPNGTARREFNGAPVYIIPLHTDPPAPPVK